MASKLTPQQSPQAPSSSFWQLISGVAHDLDLMLQDLFPDAIPSPLREEYGLTDDIALDHESFANHASLLEQFMRGAGPDAAYLGPPDPGSEYRSSKSMFAETPTSDSCDGRTTPTSTSSPSPPPPAPPPRSIPPTSLLHYPGDYSSNLPGAPVTPPAGAQSAMVSSSSISSVQETSDGDSSHTSSSFAPCDIGLLERLIRTHPIWFLPGIGRAGAVHLLQGKDVGNFIVRQSSKPNTMALSVRLPVDKGPYVEHYLIETVGDAQLRLEGSDNNFHAIPMLVAHYCQCCDELPVQLSLPTPLAQAASRQELSSLALLGQDFWLSSLVHSPVSAPPTGSSFHSTAPVNNLPLHSTFKPATSTNNLPNGSSQSSALPSNNSEQLHNLSSPSSGSPPPPVAPKHQAHSAPPPPPPRSFLTAKTTSTPNIPSQNAAPLSSDSSPDLSPSNKDLNIHPTVMNGEQPETGLQNKFEEPENKKVEKKITRVAHYKQSNIVDLTPAYYKSSLADKISDYEDIWGNAVAVDSEQKTQLKTFQSPKNEDEFVEGIKVQSSELFQRQTSENILDVNMSFMYTQGTQTNDSSGAAMLESLSDMQSHREQTFDLKDNSAEETQNFSSPFYSEPVDSEQAMNSCKPALSDLDLLPQRLLNHRFSDPNLHWPQNAACRKVETTLDEERLSSLSSSVDNIKGLGPSAQHRKQMSTQWVQELNQRISSHSTKRDCQTQVSINDLVLQKPESKKSSSSPKKGKRKQNNSAWPLDSSWEWMAHDGSSSDDDDMPITGTLDSKFPLHLHYKDVDSQLGDMTTVEDIIALRSPELALPDIRPLTQSNVMRVSEYDNLDRPVEVKLDVTRQRLSEVVDDAATEFCEPWDSCRWERWFHLVIPETDILGDDDTVQREKMENQRNVFLENNKKNDVGKSDFSNSVGFEDTESNSTVSAYSDVTSEGNDDTSASDYPTMGSDRYRGKSFEERLEPLLAAQRVVALRNRSISRIGENIRHYIFRLADERDNTFAKSIEHFIQCTKESTETKPAVVMRNIRQFMSGIKNYLLKHGEGQFENLVQEERSKLKPDEFLDIDAVIEDSLHKLVIKPLKSFIYQLFVNEYTRNGSLKLLSDNIKFARTKTPEELGVRPEFKLPEGTSLEVVKHFFSRLQQAYSPLKKLENLLAAISTIYNSVQQDKIAQGKEHVSLGAGDFLPIFICVLVQCGLIAAEIEAEYMWGLLHPSLMAREGGYYLTTLSSAVHVLKSLQACSPESPSTSETSFDNLPGASCSVRPYGMDMGSPRSQLSGIKTPSPEPRLACIADLQGFLKIMIPDELTGSIISKTLPIKPNMTTKEVAKLIAHKFNVTNPQDYNLFKLVDGEETLLGDSECPQVIKAELIASGSNCLFTYKRCDAKFIWPIMEKSS